MVVCITGKPNQHLVRETLCEINRDKISSCNHVLIFYFHNSAHSLKCWDCHDDDNIDCRDVSTNIEETCYYENDSCTMVTINGSKFGKLKA